LSHSKAGAQFIFATIFLDALGIGLLIPIFPDIIRRFSSDPEFVSRNFGYFISSYALIQFFASPVLGSLSDRFGRRPVLLVSLPAERRRAIAIKNLNPLKSVIDILAPSPITLLVWIYMLLILAGQVHPATWTLYTQYKFGWSAFDVGLSLAVVGISIAFSQGYLTRVIIPRLGEWRSVVFGVVAYTLNYLAFAVAWKGWMMYVILIPGSLTGIAMPALQSLIAKKVPMERQGELQGSLMGVASLTAIGGPLLFTALFAEFTRPGAPVHCPGASYAAAAAICAITGVMLVFASRSVTSRT
jgi:DHA1 family tetracycline resistance protein-like MFS transporter